MVEESHSIDENVVEHSLAERRRFLREVFAELMEGGDLGGLKLVLNDQYPADLADLLAHLGEGGQRQLLALLAPALAAAVLAELEGATRRRLALGVGGGKLSAWVEEMEPDDAADFVAELSPEQSAQVLDGLEDRKATAVRRLLQHPVDSGGGIMTPRLLAVSEESTVAAAVACLREWGDDEVLSLYVVDEGNRLVGTVSLRRLLLAGETALIGPLAGRDPIAVRPDVDQEEIARVFADYNLTALPVVDSQGVLLGQVTIDDVVDVMEEEATEDILEMAALSAEDLGERTIFAVVRRRLPWLLFCLGGTLLSGGVIKLFEVPLDQLLKVLVLFAPAIMAMGGNSGIQTSTVTVRSLTTGQVQGGDWQRVVWRELRVACSMGLLLGGLVFIVAQVWIGGFKLGLCVGIAMFSAIVLSAVLGASVPLAFQRFGIDPAVASGPLTTTLNDVLSLAIYFLLALALLGQAGR